MANFKTRSGLPAPPPTGQGGSPSEDDESTLESLLVRRDCSTKRFVRLIPRDRQLYFAFIALKSD
jgi:hypothetical protein